MTNDQIIDRIKQEPKTKVLELLLKFGAILQEIVRLINIIAELKAESKFQESNKQLFGKMKIVDEDRPGKDS